MAGCQDYWPGRTTEGCLIAGAMIINWTDCTFNAWEGCTKCSPGYDHCYAERHDRQHMIDAVNHWGKGAPRRMESDANWSAPLAWDR